MSQLLSLSNWKKKISSKHVFSPNPESIDNLGIKLLIFFFLMDPTK